MMQRASTLHACGFTAFSWLKPRRIDQNVRVSGGAEWSALRLRRESEPSHKKFTQTILDISPSSVREVGGCCAPSLAVSRGNGGAVRWRGAYGISGNRGASAFTNSSRSWPRVRSRLAAGVPSASGLRRADQIPGSGFEVAAAAHVNSASSPKKRIMLSAARPFLAGDFWLGT